MNYDEMMTYDESIIAAYGINALCGASVTLVNLTPHALNIVSHDGEVVIIPPSGTVARVETDRSEVNWMPVGGQIIQVYEPNFGEIVGLPPQQPYTAYVVSAQVAQRTDRPDVYSPGELLRDEAGRVIGCHGLTFHGQAR